jgi:hypothetical protein
MGFNRVTVDLSRKNDKEPLGNTRRLFAEEKTNSLRGAIIAPKFGTKVPEISDRPRKIKKKKKRNSQ